MLTTNDIVTRAQQALLHHLDGSYGDWGSDPRVVESARGLSEGFTRSPDERTPDLEARTIRAAYLAYFAPRAIAAMAHVWTTACSTDDRSIVLDVGAGTGGAALVAAAGGARRVVLVDRDPQALAVAERLLGALAPPPLIETRALDFWARNWKVPFATCLVSAFSLGELLRDHAAEDVFDKFLEAAPNAKSWLLVDAGDAARARKMQTFRDLALTRGFAIAAPCPHADECPALVRKKDWCHTKISRALPERLAAFARAVGRDDVSMNLSFLSMRREAVSEKMAPPALRVLGDPMREKGRVRLPVCGPDGMRFLQALKRHRDVHDTLMGMTRGQEFELVNVPRHGDTAHLDSDSALRFRPELPPTE